MTTLSRLQEDIADELKLLNEDIAATLHSPNPLMNEVVDNYLRTKGKQIRPILVILSAKLFGKVNPETISAATSVELLHNASLIHDDVVDETKLRRNKPTINGIWDNHIAVLVGDYFVSTALQLVITTGDLRAVNTIASLGRLLSTGEIDQINNATNHSISEESYFEIITHKTASLFMPCVEMGANASDATPEQLDIMRRFALLFGQCFLIKDDIFDYFHSDSLGKPTGNDLREGKVTLPLIYALNATGHPRCAEMNELVSHDRLSDEEIATLIGYAIEAGGIEYADATLMRLRDEAAAVLASLGDVDTTPLLSLLDYIIARDM